MPDCAYAHTSRQARATRGLRFQLKAPLSNVRLACLFIFCSSMRLVTKQDRQNKTAADSVSGSSALAALVGHVVACSTGHGCRVVGFCCAANIGVRRLAATSEAIRRSRRRWIIALRVLRAIGVPSTSCAAIELHNHTTIETPNNCENTTVPHPRRGAAARKKSPLERRSAGGARPWYARDTSQYYDKYNTHP